MPPPSTLFLLRALFVAFTLCVGSMIGFNVLGSAWLGVGAGGIFGLTIILGDQLLKGISLRFFSSATFGLLLGYLFAQLLLASNLMRGTSEDVQWITGLALYATCAYVGMMLAIRSHRDELALVIPFIRFRRSMVMDEPVLVDSNILIDGQIIELCATGFVSSSLIVARSVLDELQRLADSADPLKRERGRAALARLQQMQSNPALSVTIHETDPEPDIPVDTQLARLARLLDVRLLTNDSNLCAIARLQGVHPLNINDLVRALRPVLSAGQTLDLQLTKEGREPHQAVGYLGDGTMIIVNHARPLLGKTARVIIGSAHQTSAGRLFFAELAT